MELGGPTFCFILGGVTYILSFLLVFLKKDKYFARRREKCPSDLLENRGERKIRAKDETYQFVTGPNQFDGIVRDLGYIGIELILLGGAQLDYYLTAMIVFFALIIPFSISFFWNVTMTDFQRYDGEAETYKLTSVYLDPEKPFDSVFFKILVPQVISMILYILELRKDLGDDGWSNQERWYAFLGILFVPIFYLSTGLLEIAAPSLKCALVLRGVALDKPRPWTKKCHVTFKRDNGWGRTGGKEELDFDDRDDRDAWLLKNFTGTTLYLMVFFHVLVNCAFALILYLSLPIFLAHSDGHITFVLNAMAMLFVLQLDDLGSNINGSEISVTFGHSDEEDPGASKDSDKVADTGPGPKEEDSDASDEADPAAALESMVNEAAAAA